MKEYVYSRQAAVDYARKWAFDRNPAYYNFDQIGGDCTNFVSQCLFAGWREMDFTPTYGWYYRSLSDRAPAWTGVEYLYRFLIGRKAGTVVELQALRPGDVIQLQNSAGRFYHTLIVTKVSPVVLVAAHSFDALDRALESYDYQSIRGIRIGPLQI